MFCGDGIFLTKVVLAASPSPFSCLFLMTEPTVPVLITPPAPTSVVTTRRTCPLCESKSRREIDILCASFRQANEGDPVEGEVVDGRTTDEETADAWDETDIASVHVPTLDKLEQNIREMLGKLRDADTEFTTADLVIHLDQHTLATRFAGVQVRTEGNYLIVGEQEVYQKVDLKDSLNLFILKGVEQIVTGKMKITPAAWTNATALLWRMMGNAGADEFIQAMIEKTQKGQVTANSPLGASYEEHLKNLAKKQARIEREDRELEEESKKEPTENPE